MIPFLLKKNKDEEDENLSIETQITNKDTCDLLGELNEKIYTLKKDNKDVLEKERKIKIINKEKDNLSDEDIDEGSEKSEEEEEEHFENSEEEEEENDEEQNY